MSFSHPLKWEGWSEMTQSHPSLPLQRINECLCLLFYSALVTCWFQLARDYLDKIMVKILFLTFCQSWTFWRLWLVARRCQWCWCAIQCSTISAFKQGNTFSLLQKNTQKYIYFTRTTGQYCATPPQTPKQVSIFFSSRSRGHILDSRLCLVNSDPSWQWTACMSPEIVNSHLWVIFKCHPNLISTCADILSTLTLQPDPISLHTSL